MLKTLTAAALVIAALGGAAQAAEVGFSGMKIVCETFDAAQQVAWEWQNAPAYNNGREIAYRNRCQDFLWHGYYPLVEQANAPGTSYALVKIKGEVHDGSGHSTGPNGWWVISLKTDVVTR